MKFDGVKIEVGDRVLLRHQPTPTLWQRLKAWVLRRPAPEELNGVYVYEPVACKVPRTRRRSKKKGKRK